MDTSEVWFHKLLFPPPAPSLACTYNASLWHHRFKCTQQPVRQRQLHRTYICNQWSPRNLMSIDCQSSSSSNSSRKLTVFGQTKATSRLTVDLATLQLTVCKTQAPRRSTVQLLSVLWAAVALQTMFNATRDKSMACGSNRARVLKLKTLSVSKKRQTRTLKASTRQCTVVQQHPLCLPHSLAQRQRKIHRQCTRELCVSLKALCYCSSNAKLLFPLHLRH
jgi:hypothetical protein